MTTIKALMYAYFGELLKRFDDIDDELEEIFIKVNNIEQKTTDLGEKQK